MGREIDEAWIEEAIDRYRRVDQLRAEFEKAVAAHYVHGHGKVGECAAEGSVLMSRVDLTGRARLR